MSRAPARKKMAKDLMTKVGFLCSKMLDHERASSSLSGKRNRENMRQRVDPDVVGRDEDVGKLLAWLTNDDDSNLQVISVVGKQACGKTTLVRSVFSNLKIKHHFDCRAWVCVKNNGAESDQMQSLLVDILKQTPLEDQARDLEHKQEEQLFEVLHKSLMGLRYLIVLDNLRDANLINELLVPFVDSTNGSRVIVTTTNEKMQKLADPWTPDLQILPQLTCSECEELLRVSIVRGGNSIDGDLESKMTILKERILGKCKFSPPEISLLGGLLSTVEGSNWEALINRLEERPTLDVIRLSFDGLPYVMKPCVLYMTIFPKEFEIPTRRLFRLWAAEGLVAKAADESGQMPSAEDCFRQLESRNLIRVVRQKLDGSARSCCMPALVNDFFCREAKELGLLQIQYSSDSVFDSEQSAQNQQKQAQNKATGHYGYKVRCLQSFALFNTRKLGTKAKTAFLLESSILDARLILLRVLDLEGVYKPVLPVKFVNKLRNLRYLGLRWTALDFIPESVRNLLLLETLDLKHTNITKVTSSIWHAKNLRHLYLSQASFNESIQFPTSSNPQLETLWGLFIETNRSPMLRALENLQSLKKLGVTCHPEAVKVVIRCVLKMTKLESLRLRSTNPYGQPLQALSIRSRDLFGPPASLELSDMSGHKSLSNLYLLGSLRPVKNLSLVLPENLKALTLSMSELEENPMPVLGRLQNLIILRLLAQSYKGRRLFCDKDHFPRLRVFKLWMLEDLIDIIVEKGGMGNLEELEIRQCKSLWGVYGLNHITSLKSLSLTGVDVGFVGGVEISQQTEVKPKKLGWL
ncbi:hypothetical protein BT93_I0611 [Corymbia citriodora subsp. variegata]|nr:hypothetical protein BT93_I0611 [Corymbia citriodora subsp. variegata]